MIESPVSNAQQVSTLRLPALPRAPRVSRASTLWRELHLARRVLEAPPGRPHPVSILMTVWSAVLVSFLTQSSQQHVAAAAWASLQ